MLVVEDLVKHYGDLVAVEGISFKASEGRVFGLLGPNGAGKSTTINCISGLLRPTSGKVSVAGFDVREQARIFVSLFVDTEEQYLDKPLMRRNGLDRGEASSRLG